MTSFLVQVLDELADCAGSDSENLALAYVMLLHKSVGERKGTEEDQK